ncbi:tRNA(Ile)-lysidine synthase [Actinomycetota bacterium]|nr:tRNA(Ile)-lysidine synthase [Actinomycetota bacterium]
MRNRTVQKALGELKTAVCLLPKQFNNIVVGVSGGADSLALLKVCTIRYPGRVNAVIIDHQLQNGSDVVAAKAAAICEKLGVPTTVLRVDVGGSHNLEENARDERYVALLGCVKEDDVLMLGHTQNDQAETVLLGLGRGSGLSAVKGMPQFAWRTAGEISTGISGAGTIEKPYTRILLRPFLQAITRSDTEEICQLYDLDYYSDPTNGVVGLVDVSLPNRSRIRNEVLPRLVDVFPGIIQNLTRTATLSTADLEFLDDLANDALKQCLLEGSLAIEKLMLLNVAIRRRVIRLWLKSMGVQGSGLEFAKIDAVDDMILNRGLGGKTVDICKGVQVVKSLEHQTERPSTKLILKTTLHNDYAII